MQTSYLLLFGLIFSLGVYNQAFSMEGPSNGGLNGMSLPQYQAYIENRQPSISQQRLDEIGQEVRLRTEACLGFQRLTEVDPGQADECLRQAFQQRQQLIREEQHRIQSQALQQRMLQVDRQTPPSNVSSGSREIQVLSQQSHDSAHHASHGLQAPSDMLNHDLVSGRFGHQVTHRGEVIHQIHEQLHHLFDHPQEGEPNAYRDFFIRSGVKIAGHLVLASTPHSYLTMVASHGANHMNNRLIAMQNSCGSPPEGVYQTYLYNLCRQTHGDAQAAYAVGAVPARLCNKVANMIEEGAIQLADRAQITEENIIKIAQSAHQFLTQTAPHHLRTSYESWILRSKQKYTQWRSRLAELSRENPDHVVRIPLTEISSQENNESSSVPASIRDASLPLINRAFEVQQEQLLEWVTNYRDLFHELHQLEHATQPAIQQQHRAPVEAHVNRMQEFATVRTRMSDVVTGIAAGASIFGHENTAHRIQVGGAGLMQLMEGVNGIATQASAVALGLSEAGATSFIHPAVTFVVGVASILNLFKHRRNRSEDQSLHIIMSALSQISQQLQCVNERLEGIENFLQDHHRVVLREFFSLHQGQDLLQDKLHRIAHRFSQDQERSQISLNSLHILTQNNNQAMLDCFRNENDAETQLLLRSALECFGRNVKIKDLEKHLKKLYLQAVVAAQQPNVTGGNIDSENAEAIARALTSSSSSAINHPVFANVGLLNKILSNHYGVISQALVNPLIWKQCSEMFVKLLADRLERDGYYPENEEQRLLLTERLGKLINEGTKFLTFVQNLQTQTLPAQLKAAYQNSLRDLSQALGTFLQTYESRKTEKIRILHRTHLDSEKALVATMPPIDFKKVQKHAWNAFHGTSGSLIASETAASAGKDLGIFWCGCGRFFEIVGRGNLALPNAENIQSKAQGKYQDDRQKLIDTLEQKNVAYLSSLAFKLFEEDRSVAASIAGIIYPQQGDYSVFLGIPNQDLLIPLSIVQQERKGEGFVRWEYKMSEENFHLYGYFVTNKTGNKQLFIEFCKKHDLDKGPYTNEDIWSWWYGGWFYKPERDNETEWKEYYNWRYNVPKNAIKFSNMNSWLGYTTNPHPGFIHTIPLIPSKAYPAARDTFVAHAERVPVNDFDEQRAQNELDNLKKEQQKKFSAKVTREVRAPGSSLYQAVQKLNLDFKMLESVLMLLYSDAQQAQPLLHELAAENLRYVKDQKAILNFLADYVRENSSLPTTLEYLPQLLDRTNETVSNILASVDNLRISPSVEPVQTMVDQLRAVLVTLQSRTISARPVQRTLEEQRVSQQRQEMQDDNNAMRQQLTSTQQQLATTQNQLQSMTQQMQQLQEQMQAMMRMMQASSGGQQQNQPNQTS